MLIRPHDAATTDDEWRNLLNAHPFGTLIAPGADRDLPVVVPTHVHFDGDTTIRLHLADQLATMQPEEPHGDPRDPTAPYTSELRQIRGLELAINHVRAKFKFDGAEPDIVRQQVVDGYHRRNAPGDSEALDHLLRRHSPTHP